MGQGPMGPETLGRCERLREKLVRKNQAGSTDKTNNSGDAARRFKKTP